MKKIIIFLTSLILSNYILSHETHPISPNNQNEADNHFTKALETQLEVDYLAAYTLFKTPTVQRQRGAKFKLAYLQQHFHEFDQALVTLSHLNKSAQTSLLQASIYLTQGKIAKAKSACAALIGKTDYLLTTTCIAKGMSRDGQQNQGYDLLRNLTNQQMNKQTAQHASEPNDALQWAYATLAEMALSLNKNQESEAYYQKALSVKSTDTVSRLEYADLLLSQVRYQDVVNLTENYTNNAAIFIRFVLANRALNHPEIKSYMHDLKSAVLTMKSRNQHLHFDTLAEHALLIENNPMEALKWARLHWAQQKTPRDALLLIKTARAAGDQGVVKEIEGWKNNSIE